MKIDFEDSKIILVDDNNELKSSHQSQLFFWGSKEDDTGLLLEKVYGYLQKYFRTINVLGGAQNVVNKVGEQKNSLLDVISGARDYKNGVFDHSEFDNFCLFLEKNLARDLHDHQKKSAYHLFLLKSGANFSVPFQFQVVGKQQLFWQSTKS
jgi:hypothetical protein